MRNQCDYLLQITDIRPQPPTPKYVIASKSMVAGLTGLPELDHNHSPERKERKQDLDNVF